MTLTTIFRVRPAVVSGGQSSSAQSTRQENNNQDLKYSGGDRLEQFASSDASAQKTSSQSTEAPRPVVNKDQVGRNESCPCGSGKKYKKCCGKS